MTRMHGYRQAAAGLLLAFMVQAASAGTVTVNVSAHSGASVEDTVLIFDPLDAIAPPSHDAAVIDQVNKKFVPRVSVIRTGTAVTFPNSDRIRHQVYSFSPAKTFTLKLYAGPSTTPVEFDKAGLVVLGCNIHDNMAAFVGVVDTPYFAKTTNSGVAVLNLPPGRYRMRVWHPNAATPIAAQQLTITAAPQNIALPINVDTAATSVAAWPE
jgi:plastocyanin